MPYQKSESVEDRVSQIEIKLNSLIEVMNSFEDRIASIKTALTGSKDSQAIVKEIASIYGLFKNVNEKFNKIANPK